jgi:uncharacterized protein YecT (DUF1311 family)
MKAAKLVVGFLLVAAAMMAHATGPLDECTDRSPTMAGIGDCLDDLLHEADGELRTRGKAVLALMRKLQKQTGSPRAAQAFINAQNRFRAFRRAECDRRATRANTQEDAERLRQDCLIRLTRERAEELATVLPAGSDVSERQPAVSTSEKPAHTLFGVEWRLVRRMTNGREQPLAQNSRVILIMSEGGSVTGRTSVSVYSGRYTLRDGGRLEWWQGGFLVERTSGRLDVSDPDEELLDELAQTTRLRLSSPGLILQSDDGSVVLAFAR